LSVGQITLVQSVNAPKPNTDWDFYIDASTAAERNKSGAGITWNFSNASGTKSNFSYEGSGGGSAPASFPNANLVELASNGENYYESSASGLVLQGHNYPGVTKIEYNDEREFMFYPITYMDSRSETFDGEVDNLISMQTFDRSGTIDIIADGYGTIILPYDTIENVLKVMSVIDYGDTWDGVPIGTYIDTVITWHNASLGVFVASTSVSYTNGVQQLQQTTFLAEEDFLASVNGFKNNLDIQFFPNPTNNILNINNNQNDVVQLNIFTLTGAEVYSTQLTQGRNTIDLSDLENGVYILNYTLDGEVTTQRMIVGK